MIRHTLLAALALLFAAPAFAQPKETWIPIFVTPYYEAAAKPGEAPKVKVGDGLNALLQSTKPKDIRAARDIIVAKPEKITPMAMMVMAIRFYDTGQRDEAVKWFYIGKYRAITLMETISFTRGPMSDGIQDALGAFINLAGSYINGYAFCDVGKQKLANAAAIDWVEAHPYMTIYEGVLKARAKPGGIDANLKRAIASIRAAVDKESAELEDPDRLKILIDTRAANKMDQRFCWKTP